MNRTHAKLIQDSNNLNALYPDHSPMEKCAEKKDIKELVKNGMPAMKKKIKKKGL